MPFAAQTMSHTSNILNRCIWNQVKLFWRDWGRKLGLLRHNLHIFLHIFELRAKKMKLVTKLFLYCGLRFLKKWLKRAPKNAGKKAKKKHQKNKKNSFHNLWLITRPKRFILSYIWGHFLTSNFSLAFISVLVTRPLEI